MLIHNVFTFIIVTIHQSGLPVDLDTLRMINTLYSDLLGRVPGGGQSVD